MIKNASRLIFIEIGIPLVVAIGGLFLAKRCFPNIDMGTSILFNIVLTYLTFSIVQKVIHRMYLNKIYKQILTDFSLLIENQQQFLNNTEKKTDATLSALIKHLKDDYFIRCTSNDKACAKCSKYQKSCDGLFRNFLSRDCDILHSAFEDMNKGQYTLNRNIEEYHTIAIEQMVIQQIKTYNVIHYIETKNDSEPQYNEHDISFIRILLETIYSRKDFEKAYYDVVGFKINWLFVGDYTHIRNNYDYLIKVLLEKVDAHKITVDKINQVFNFYNISERDFSTQINGRAEIKSYISTTKPNIGIFGDAFVFVESASHNVQHGLFYSSPAHPIHKINQVFAKLLRESKSLKWGELVSLYKSL